MKLTDFSFNLPEDQIAQHPTQDRGQSRLLVLNRETGELHHSHISEIKKYIPDNTLLVFNNSRVRKARVYATSETGGKVELVFLRPILDTTAGKSWEVLTSKAKKQKIGKVLILPDRTKSRIINNGNSDLTKILETEIPLSESWFDLNGHIPLPPYIKRDDAAEDFDRYQTLYSSEVGSCAAPTAGLHFTNEILSSLNDDVRSISTAEVTLHVGLGTFIPVRTENIQDHDMHTEHFHISDDVAAKINLAVSEGKNILAVGTTSVRTLESAVRNGKIQAGYGETNIFIYPGYSFKIVNRLFTNFHTPESTLLMLVSAFAGRVAILNAYDVAIKEKYRFFSYGDAMLIL